MSARITRKPHSRTYAFCMWPSFYPLLAASRYVMYFRLCGWRHVFTQLPYGASCVFLYAATEHDKRNSRDSSQILLNDKDRKYSVWVAHRWGGVCYPRLLCFVTQRRLHSQSTSSSQKKAVTKKAVLSRRWPLDAVLLCNTDAISVWSSNKGTIQRRKQSGVTDAVPKLWTKARPTF